MNTKKGAIFTILSAVSFGFAFTLGPMTYGDGGSNAVTLTFLRNFIPLPLIYFLLVFQKISLKVSKKQLKQLILLGIMGPSITTLLLNIAFSFIDVGIVTTVHFVYPVFVTLGCAIFFKEKLSKSKLIALIIATSGIGCFFLEASNSSAQNLTLGIILALASGITYAFYMIYLDKSGLTEIPPFKVTFYISSVSSVVILLSAIITKELTISTLTHKSWILTVIFAILCTVVALSLVQIGIKNIGPSTAAILSTFEPITSVTFGFFLLGEKITHFKLLGCLLILTGVIILSRSKDTNVH